MREENEIEVCETRLRQAMLASDVEALDELLSDQLVFTDQEGRRLSKNDDLAAHRSGALKIEAINHADPALIQRLGTVALVAVRIELTGRYEGKPFLGRFAYSRVWRFERESWKVVLAHCSVLSAIP